MSFLSDKYKVPPETVKKMTRDGIISCAWVGREEVYRLWKEGKSVIDISVSINKSESYVYDVLRNYLQKKV